MYAWVHKSLLFVALVASIALQGCGGSTYLALNGPERAALEQAKRDKKPVFVGFIETTKPDQKGAVGARAQLFNTSDRPYKYVDLLVVGYDKSGRIAAPFAGDKQLVRLRFEGPLQPKQSKGATRWAKVWYDEKVSCVEIRRIDITHTDGSRLRVGRGDANQLLPAPARKSCRRV